MLPDAFLVHHTAERARIRIPSQKGDLPYFTAIGDKLNQFQKLEHLVINAETGSILVIDAGLDIDLLERFAEEKDLFHLRRQISPPLPLSRRLMKPIGDISSSFDRFTGGEIDLPGAAFLALLGVGIYQIWRGNLRAPPWYTAFWYAMGIFTKSIMEKGSKDKDRSGR